MKKPFHKVKAAGGIVRGEDAPVNVNQVEAMSGLGFTTEEMAMAFGLTANALKYHVDKNPDLADAMERGKLKFDANVVEAVRKRATGYDYVERIYVRRITTGPDGKPREEMVLDREIHRHTPPDPTTAMFWLQNRRPQDWKYVGKLRMEHEQLTNPEKEWRNVAELLDRAGVQLVQTEGERAVQLPELRTHRKDGVRIQKHRRKSTRRKTGSE